VQIERDVRKKYDNFLAIRESFVRLFSTLNPRMDNDFK